MEKCSKKHAIFANYLCQNDCERDSKYLQFCPTRNYYFQGDFSVKKHQNQDMNLLLNETSFPPDTFSQVPLSAPKTEM